MDETMVGPLKSFWFNLFIKFDVLDRHRVFLYLLNVFVVAI